MLQHAAHQGRVFCLGLGQLLARLGKGRLGRLVRRRLGAQGGLRLPKVRDCGFEFGFQIGDARRGVGKGGGVFGFQGRDLLILGGLQASQTGVDGLQLGGGDEPGRRRRLFGFRLLEAERGNVDPTFEQFLGLGLGDR